MHRGLDMGILGLSFAVTRLTLFWTGKRLRMSRLRGFPLRRIE
jgi:hypothetical protein